MQVEHRRFSSARDGFAALAEACDSGADFVDGVMFGRGDLVLSVGHLVDQAPWLSDYTGQHIYYRSLRERSIAHLTTSGYLWRWDTDWFWCSKNFGAQNPLLRRLYGRRHLNSRTYTRLMRWNALLGLSRLLARWRAGAAALPRR